MNFLPVLHLLPSEGASQLKLTHVSEWVGAVVYSARRFGLKLILKGSYYAFHFLNFSQCVVCMLGIKRSTKLQISKSTPKGDISI